MKNTDLNVVKGFGDEWKRFDQSKLDKIERDTIFSTYFSIFPWDKLPSDAIGFDLGCGTGRWAALVAPKVKQLHCIDPSEALELAKNNLTIHTNCSFHHASVDNIPLENNSMDFGYSLGVLHHVPDTLAGLKSCVEKLKPEAPFLVYLYYAFDNKPLWFKLLWKTSDQFRKVISKLPHTLKFIISQIIALIIYFPLARLAYLFEKLGLNVDNFPLTGYRNVSFYTMRTDALDRFGTRLEQRFTQKEIKSMMLGAGLEEITFNKEIPYWCAVGYKKCVE
jgi:ubiquinone/menaquinone biosynthesis C-methylase UbiE